MNTNPEANRKMVNALFNISFEIKCFRNSKFLLPVMVDVAESINKVKVEVFIPPPVEPGEAPTNIKKIKNNSMGWPIIAKSTVLKPAVLAVVD